MQTNTKEISPLKVLKQKKTNIPAWTRHFIIIITYIETYKFVPKQHTTASPARPCGPLYHYFFDQSGAIIINDLTGTETYTSIDELRRINPTSFCGGQPQRPPLIGRCTALSALL